MGFINLISISKLQDQRNTHGGQQKIIY